MSASQKRRPRPKRIRLADIVRKRLLDPAAFWLLVWRVVR